jgi:D-glycero-beta-D-manno-heptose-7-phosphate kinase
MYNQLFRDITQLKVAIVGDVMLDSYWWGQVERISPEAPVPVVALHHKEQRIGGAGNVALNIAALGAMAFICSVTGADEHGESLGNLLHEQHIDTSFLLTSEHRITTNKTRIISRNQQMMRLDEEMTRDLSVADEDRLIQSVRQCLEEEKPQILIFEDYNKGVLTERVINELIQLCKERNVLTAVDPKRKHFFSYKNVDIFKPNLKEVKEGLNLLLEDINQRSLHHIHQELNRLLSHRISLITLSEKGVFYEDEHQSAIIPSHIRNVADVSGAGDTVIAVASLVYAATKDVALMAAVANIAGGLVCEEVGTAPISKEKLLTECNLLLR